MILKKLITLLLATSLVAAAAVAHSMGGGSGSGGGGSGAGASGGAVGGAAGGRPRARLLVTVGDGRGRRRPKTVAEQPCPHSGKADTGADIAK